MDIKGYIAKKKKIIDKALDKYLPSGKVKPQALHKAMRYSVFPGGKRIRPVLVIAAFEACGGKEKAIMPVACAIELIHTYTLVHDDLPAMDNDDSRRGKPSCHKKFNEAIAILTGDALLTLGFQLLSEAGCLETIGDISKAIGTYGTVGGQVVDIEETKKEKGKTKNELDYITSHKTGSLIEASVKAGGIFKNANKKKLKSFSEFGKCIGFTFQLVDDLIDNDGYVRVYGDAHVRKMARLLTERAKSHLDIFGQKAKTLSDIADLILNRKS